MTNARVPEGASQEVINKAINDVWKSGNVQPGEMVGVDFCKPIKMEVPRQISTLIGAYDDVGESEEEK